MLFNSFYRFYTNKNISFYFCSIFFLFFSYQLLGQGTFHIQTTLNQTSDKITDLIIKKNCTDTLCVQQVVKENLSILHKNGYLLAYVDTIIKKDSLFTIKIETQKKFTWGAIRRGNLPNEIYERFNSKELGGTLNMNALHNLFDEVVRDYENIGYPFAQIKLDSIKLNNDSVHAAILLDKGKQIVIDSIKINGNVKLSPLYLYRYIEIEPGQLYNEQKIRAIPNKISELSFASLKYPPSVLFTNRYNTLNLHLVKKKNSNFHGVVGVLPDNEGKVTITGEANLRLVNSFYKGEALAFKWKRIQNNTQNLDIEASYPYVFNSNLGLRGALDLFRKDTSFSNLNATLAIQYLFTSQNFIEAFLERKSSNVLGNVVANTSDPRFLDVRATGYGIALNQQNLDYRLNPYKGYLINVRLSAGEKKIQPNPTLVGISYDSLNLSATEIKTNVTLNAYVPLFSKVTLKLGVTDKRIISSNLFENEFYRIGGLFTLRGFDEESIYASSFTILTIEPRLILEKNSHLYAFYDLAYYENNTLSRSIKGYPMGFGAGISFETKPGIFTFTYALGQHVFFEDGIRKNAGFTLRAGKVHFGFINYF